MPLTYSRRRCCGLFQVKASWYQVFSRSGKCSTSTQGAREKSARRGPKAAIICGCHARRPPPREDRFRQVVGRQPVAHQRIGLHVGVFVEKRPHPGGDRQGLHGADRQQDRALAAGVYVAGNPQARLEAQRLVAGLAADPQETMRPADLRLPRIDGQMRRAIERQREDRLRGGRAAPSARGLRTKAPPARQPARL